MHRYILPLLVGLIATASSGCEGPNPNLGATAASVQLGTGENAFEAVADGQMLHAASGGQGGVHIWGSFRLDGFSVQGGPPLGFVGMRVEMGIEHSEGSVAGMDPFDASVNAATGEFSGGTVFVGIDPQRTPFLYPPGFWSGEDESASPSSEEWQEAQEYLEESLTEGLTMWVRVEDSEGSVLEDAFSIGIEGVSADPWG